MREALFPFAGAAKPMFPHVRSVRFVRKITDLRACATETDFSVPEMLAAADDETRICVYLYTCIPILFLNGDSIGWDSWATATLVLPTVFSLLHYRTRKRGQLS